MDPDMYFWPSCSELVASHMAVAGCSDTPRPSRNGDTVAQVTNNKQLNVWRYLEQAGSWIATNTIRVSDRVLCIYIDQDWSTDEQYEMAVELARKHNTTLIVRPKDKGLPF